MEHTTSNAGNFSTHPWVRQLLERNNLNEPNSQPLYRYQVSEQEYNQLANILRNIGEPTDSNVMDKVWCAAFCIFCSEWFRRKYQGAWTWDGPLNELNFSISPNLTSKIVKKGLVDFWKLTLSQYTDNRNSYLGSVFREGGLPFALIAEHGGRFQQLFKRIIRQYNIAKALGQPTKSVIYDSLLQLPEAFHKDTTVELISEMTELVITLTDKHDLYGQNDPVKYLDNELPNWQSLFPIPLDATTGGTFLSGLLKSASAQGTSLKTSKRITHKHWLLNKTELKIRSSITLAKRISFSIKKDQLVHGRVEVFVLEGERQIGAIGTGHVQFDEEQAYVILPKTGCEFTREVIAEELSILVFHAGQVLVNEPIIGTEFDLEQQPIVLVEEDERLNVVGVGSCSHRSEELFAVIPQDSEIEETIENIDAFGEYHLIKFTDTATVRFEHEKFVLSCRANLSVSDEVRLSGNTLPFSTKTGQPIYLGLPKITIPNQTNTQIWIGSERIENGHILSSYGQQMVAIKSHDGITLFRKKLAVLPADFNIKIKPSNKPSEGIIEFVSNRRFIFKLLSDSVDTEVQKNGHGKVVTFLSNNQPPASLEIELTCNFDAQPIVLNLPFPSTGVQAFNRDGLPLSRYLLSDDLLGARLILYPCYNRSATYMFELIGDARVQEASYFWKYTVAEKPLELSLYEFRHRIQELLAVAGDNLDSDVRIRISGDCSIQTFYVKRYACTAEFEENGLQIKSDGFDVNETKPVLIDLSDPKCKPKPLVPRLTESVQTGFFDTPNAVVNPSLVVPEKDSGLQFRAKYIAPTDSALNTDKVETLQKAAQLFHPKTNRKVFHDVFDLMVQDFNHSGWVFLEDLFENHGYLPLATFEVWRELVKHNGLLACLGFKLENPTQLMDRLQEEFNILWDLIPLTFWQGAFTIFKKPFEALPEDLIDTISKGKFELLSNFSSIFGDDSSLNLVKTGQGLPIQMCTAILPSSFDNWKTDLLRVHADDNKWPTHFSKELEGWLLRQTHFGIDILPQRGYQKTVVLMPFFAAAVCSAKVEKFELAYEFDAVCYFHLKQIIEFDRKWFNSMFQLALNIFNGN